MYRHFVWLFLGLFLAAAPVQGAPLEVYGRLPTIEDMAISPDGTLLAYVTFVESKRTIIIYAIDKAKAIDALDIGDQKLRDLSWADNDRLLITTSRTSVIAGLVGPKSENFLTQSYSISTKTSHFLLNGIPNTLDVTVGGPMSRTVNGHTVVFVHGYQFVGVSGYLALFSVDLDTGHATVVEPASKYSEGWILDEAGNVIAVSEYDNKSRLWTLKLLKGGEWKSVYSITAEIDAPDVLGVTEDGSSLMVRTVGNDGIETKQISLADGTLRPVADPDRDGGGPIFDPATQRIIGTAYFDGQTSYVFSKRDDQLAWNSVAHAFPGENVSLASWSSDRKRVVVLVDGTRDGSQYQLVDLNTNMARPLGPAYQGIGAADVAEVKFIHYAAADGTSIPAYLTLPKGRPPKNLPLVVFPHGGPMAEDSPGFDWWAQAMASRGYAVLQPQFRGSSGFGWKHTAAGFGQWGRKMQTDLSDGVRFLAGEGLVDPKRVCIVGASYGGYAALAGPTLDRGVYRCAVSVSGVADPPGLLSWIRHRDMSRDDPALRFWDRFMGADNYTDPKLAEISPLAHAANADAPILLIHGYDDTVVPIVQSENMEDALNDAHKPVTFIKLHSEDHWLSTSETREQMLEATVSFLETYNPPN